MHMQSRCFSAELALFPKYQLHACSMCVFVVSLSFLNALMLNLFSPLILYRRTCQVHAPTYGQFWLPTRTTQLSL